MKSLIKFVFVFIILSVSIAAQEKPRVEYNRISINGGVDLFARGARLGLMILPLKHFSIEASYGRDALDAFSDWDVRSSVGINWHEGDESNLLIGLAFSHASFIQMNTAPIRSRENFISLMAGSYIINEGGVQFFYRGGMVMKIDDTAKRRISFGPNIDIGISLNLL